MEIVDRFKSARHAWKNPYALTVATKHIAEVERRERDLDNRNFDLLDEIGMVKKALKLAGEVQTGYEKALRSVGEVIPEEFRRPGMSDAGQVSLIVDALREARVGLRTAQEAVDAVEWGYPEQEPAPEDFRQDFRVTVVKPRKSPKAKKPVKKVAKKPVKKPTRKVRK